MNTQNDTLTAIINDHILADQTLLVKELIKNAEDFMATPYIRLEDIKNYDEDESEVFEWLLISEWLAGELETAGAIVARSYCNCWWGREDTQLEYYLNEIAKKY